MSIGIAAYLWIALGGAIGSVFRFGIGQWLHNPPYLGTLIANISGSLLIGILAAILLSQESGESGIRYFGMIGFCGGFTTFSAFSLQTVELLSLGNYRMALLNILMNVVICIFVTAGSFKITDAFIR